VFTPLPVVIAIGLPEPTVRLNVPAASVVLLLATGLEYQVALVASWLTTTT
jgi:hypothetical protein